MEYLGYVVVGALGAIIGSFLNVVIYRLHTGRSLGGRSHCMSCGHILCWYELVPIVSYFGLRGKCMACSAYIPVRYCAVEIATALLFMMAWHLFAFDFALLLLTFIMLSVLVVVFVYDMRHTIIPDELSLALGGLSLGFLAHAWWGGASLGVLGGDVLAGLGAGAFFGGLWLISKGRWIGLGDAKLAVPLGVIVGAYSVFSMVVLAFWIGAFVSLVLLATQRVLSSGKTGLHFPSLPRTIKSEIPFAPFLIAAFLLVHFFHADIFIATQKLFFS